jgi:hypothetical protein
VATGEYDNAIELNAVQRSNPEMQKRAANAIRALAELPENPIVSIHDHGAGGHLNCLSELVEKSGGKIEIGKLPVGDPTLSDREIIGNESQERMGLVLKEKDLALLKAIADRERAPMYVVGETTGDLKFVFLQKDGEKPINLNLMDMFGNPPKTIMKDKSLPAEYKKVAYDLALVAYYIEQVLQLEGVACKDWLTNKVDRSVTGKVAKQQTAGPIQLPLNNVGVSAIDYQANDVVLHTDTSLMPVTKKAWASWNFMAEVKEQHELPVVTYCMNILQQIGSIHDELPLLVTLNGSDLIDPQRVLQRFSYAHPVYSVDSFRAQSRRHELNGEHGIHFCGAYWYNGFHEDGVRSALDVCQRFGATL